MTSDKENSDCSDQDFTGKEELTITFPVAKAGATLNSMVAIGALNGLIAAHTPIGS